MKRLLWRSLGALGLFLWTWFWFLPLGGFHHMYRCGFLGWAILDYEEAEGTVSWSGAPLAISLLFWLLGVAGVAGVRWLARRSARR